VHGLPAHGPHLSLFLLRPLSHPLAHSFIHFGSCGTYREGIGQPRSGV
jgi:hypothetical protein